MQNTTSPTEHKQISSIRKNNWQFIVVFLTVFFLLEFAYNMSRDTIVETVIIDFATVKPSAMLINIVDKTEHVQAQGHVLVSPKVRISVLNGCEGTETILLLISAIFAFSSRWQSKFIGIILGTGLVYAMNQGRIVGLYYALRYDKTLFDIIHGYIGPTLIIIIAGLFFLWFVNKCQTNESTKAAIR